ncbi:hypothetical protein HDK77DRAFT_431386 [Phyllosticta capitalensis]
MGKVTFLYLIVLLLYPISSIARISSRVPNSRSIGRLLTSNNLLYYKAYNKSSIYVYRYLLFLSLSTIVEYYIIERYSTRVKGIENKYKLFFSYYARSKRWLLGIGVKDRYY